jgi:protein arginine kinase
MNTTVKKILDRENPVLGPECDAAVRSRVRLARNLADIPYTGRLNQAGRKKVIETVNGAIGEYDFIDFSSLSPTETGALMEGRVVSLDFVKSPEEKELIADAEKGLYVMVNEEDHLRIQSLQPGFAIYEAYDEANKFDDLTDGRLDFAYDEDFGYLTQGPANLETGLRVSVMLHLPALTQSRKIQAITAELPKIGAAIRGFYGEGTEVGGDLYQISNNVTLGISEEQTLEKIKAVAEKIIELERLGRNELLKNSKDQITDKIKRACGTIKYAHMISSSEFLSLYSMIRLGIACNIVKDVGIKTLDALLVKAMPANLVLRFSGSEKNRDILRAEYIQGELRVES